MPRDEIWTMVLQVSVDEDKTIEELPPEKLPPQQAKSAAAEVEDEATTLWAKSDLFSPDDLEPQEEEPIFAEKALVQHDDDLSASTVEVKDAGAGGMLGPGATPSAVHGVQSAPETVRMSPDEAKSAMREARAAAEGYRAASSIQVAGVEGVAARKLSEDRRAAREAPPPRADAARARQPEPASTPAKAPAAPSAGPSLAGSRTPESGKITVQKSRLTCNCRICDRGVMTPRQRRLRGPISGEFGFRCDTCHNVFCAAHVVRVSSLLESLLQTGRFRCVLCDQGARAAEER